jgi:hypothetical protein
MKKCVPVLLLLLAGCGSHRSGEDNQTISLQDNLLADLQTSNGAQDAARLQSLIDRAMAAALPDASKAQYRNVQGGVGGAACGEVASVGPNGRLGPYRRFVVTPDAVAVIGTSPEIKFNDPSDFLADAWIRWCASPDELKLVEGQLGRGPAPSTEAPPSADVPNLPEEPSLPIPKQPAPNRTASAAPPPPPPQIDSFSKSVSRPQ